MSGFRCQRGAGYEVSFGYRNLTGHIARNLTPELDTGLMFCGLTIAAYAEAWVF